jgi:hypothetical protein
VSEFEANATIVEPFLPTNPMLATVETGNHSVFVDTNYFSLVKKLNPYFYIYDGSSNPVNGGSQSMSVSVPAGIETLANGGGPLNAIGEGKSWRSIDNSAITITAPSNTTSLDYISSQRNFTIEFWVKVPDIASRRFVLDTNLEIGTNSQGRLYFYGYDNPWVQFGVELTLTQEALSPNNWHHIVLTAKAETGTPDTTWQLWLDGSIVKTFLRNSSFTSGTDRSFTINRAGSANQSNIYYDEFAIYRSVLSNSDIQEHFNFINNYSPDKTVYVPALLSDAESGDHNFIVQSNSNTQATAITADSDIVIPVIGVSTTIDSDISTASADFANDPNVYYGRTMVSEPLIAYAESVNAFATNSQYFDYVQANILPYRYVSFDATNALIDYGSDADYSVDPVSIGGTVVNPDFGINNKSVKTNGSNYTTDGVILKESEYNDTWGTGQNTYHSSFWIQRAEDDASTTGLRVLWNLNGYYDNQHVILYQYQNKLYMQFNNGSGTHVEHVTTNNVDLFNYNRHFVVVAFDHTNNNNNIVNLYVDSVLVLSVNLGSYTGTTINGVTSVGPNDEANNHPRLSVGCLITPFEETALPLVPTNTKVYVDEVIWSKNAINATGVTNLYNAMPSKINKQILIDTFTASATITESSIITNVNWISEPMTANADIVEPELSVDFEIVVIVTTMTATAIFAEASRSDEATIVSDVFVATAIFNDAGVIVTIPGGPMLMTITLLEPEVNDFDLAQTASTWVRYLRATDISAISVQRGVK